MVEGLLSVCVLKMSAEEADKTNTTDASGGDEEEEWLYGGIDVQTLSKRHDCYLGKHVQLN